MEIEKAQSSSEQEVRDMVEEIRREYEEKPNAETALAYAESLYNLTIKQMDLESLTQTIFKLESLYNAYPNSDIAIHYARGLVNSTAQQSDLLSIERDVSKLEELYKLNKTSDFALRYAGGLSNLTVESIDSNLLSRTISRLENLYNTAPLAEVAISYAKSLVMLTARETEMSSIEIAISKLKELYSSDKSPNIALRYARALFNLTLVQDELSLIDNTISELVVLYKSNKTSAIALYYAKALFNRTVIEIAISAQADTISQIAEIYKEYSTADIALAYAESLLNLTAVQDELNEIIKTVSQIAKLYIDYPAADIALAYANSLYNLTLEDVDISAVETTVAKLEEMYNANKTPEIALVYLEVLGNILTHEDLRNCSPWVEKIGDLLQHFVLNQEWLDFVKWLTQFQITEELLNFKNSIPWSRFNQDFLEELLDSIFYYKKGQGLVKEEEDRQIAIFWEVITAGREQLSQTKYALFQNWSSYSEDEKSSLFQVYRLTQLLKFKLAIKKFKKDDRILQVGHYTKRDTLDIIVRYRKDSAKDEDKMDYPARRIESKSRLYNANYMNDTQEGILLDKALGLPEKDKLQPSSWYLMSLTNNHDNLSMWSQYGSNGEGVCIVLRNDSFKEVSELEKMKSFTIKKNTMELAKDLGKTDIIKDQDIEKDELYRICYLKDCKVVQSDLFEEEDVSELQEYLDRLRKAVELSSELELQEEVNSCLEEIRYLFKSADYAYESEVRVLYYVSESDRKDVAYDPNDKERRLYIERKSPMQIAKVIFGPKFANADFATPYIQWVDKDIQFERSKIHYR